jgi:hypothetical protein
MHIVRRRMDKVQLKLGMLWDLFRFGLKLNYSFTFLYPYSGPGSGGGLNKLSICATRVEQGKGRQV